MSATTPEPMSDYTIAAGDSHSKSRMPTSKETRIQNLRALVKEFGTIARVANAAQTSPAYLGQILNGTESATGTARGIGESLARKLEIGCGKPSGWMDVPAPASGTTVVASNALVTPHSGRPGCTLDRAELEQRMYDWSKAEGWDAKHAAFQAVVDLVACPSGRPSASVQPLCNLSSAQDDKEAGARAGDGATKIDKLLTIIAYAYQVAGAHDAPDHILDVLADPEAATDEQVEAMLPYVPAADGAAAGNYCKKCSSSIDGAVLGEQNPISKSNVQKVHIAFVERECRHCGWLCRPNDAPSKRGYVLSAPDKAPVQEQPQSAGEAKTCRSSEKLQVPPAGYALVPVEPTIDMVVAGHESEPNYPFHPLEECEAYEAMSGCQQGHHRAKLCWAAMIAATPAASSLGVDNG